MMLELSEEQVNAIKSVVDDAADSCIGASDSRSTLCSCFEAMRSDVENSIDDILNEEQREKITKLKEKLDSTGKLPNGPSCEDL